MQAPVALTKRIKQHFIAAAARSSEQVSHGSNPRPPALITVMNHIISLNKEALQVRLATGSPDSQERGWQVEEAQQLYPYRN